jgi:cathepsin H
MLLFSGVSANINEEFATFLNGNAPVGSEVFEKMWERFESQQGKNSPNSLKSIAYRKNIFATRVEDIISHNKDSSSSYKKGINKFSDMTEEEFNAHFHLNQISEEQHCSATEQRQSLKAKNDAPDSYDWRDNAGVSPVKNQGKCGSCWTFSTVGALEAHSLIKYGSFDSLSEQQLVDCAGDYDNFGCNGGLPSHAFEYISSVGGISTEAAYPYFGVDNKCSVDASTFALGVTGGSFNITEGDEVSLKTALFEHGPVSIAFEVVNGFSAYASGVYSSDVCLNTTGDVNHAVLAVGYGTENGLDYWIVKNSWGADWGDKGFFKIARGVNMCGVAVCNSFPLDVVKLSAQTSTDIIQ